MYTKKSKPTLGLTTPLSTFPVASISAYKKNFFLHYFFLILTSKMLITLLVGTLFLSCSTNTALDVFVLSQKEEQKLGAEFNRQLRENTAEYPVYQTGTDPKKIAFKAYIDSVWETIIDAAKIYTPNGEQIDYLNKNDFTFTIIDKDIKNAFAVPGGYVYIYTGIIRDMQDESELAGVLGHELAHVQRRHYAKSQVKGAIAGNIIKAVGGEDAGALAKAVQAGFSLLAGGYISRDHERDSDEYGTNYLGTSKRNPRGIATFFARMEGGLSIPWLSSHPESSERVSNVNKQVDGSTYLRPLDAEELKYKTRFEANVAVIK